MCDLQPIYASVPRNVFTSHNPVKEMIAFKADAINYDSVKMTSHEGDEGEDTLPMHRYLWVFQTDIMFPHVKFVTPPDFYC